jgi:hypothetical protein
MDHAETVAGHQLAKAGFRLANLLNGLRVRPIGPNDVTRTANPQTLLECERLLFIGTSKAWSK